MKKVYHIGLVKAGKKLIIQMREVVDYLSCETWIYYGERETTKKRIKTLAPYILNVVNEVQHTNFRKVKID